MWATKLTHFEGYDNITSLGGWLRRITVNKLIDHLRREKLYRATPMSALSQEVGSAVEPVYDGIPMEVLQRMINELPLKYRTAFNLYVVDEVKQAIASLLFDDWNGTGFTSNWRSNPSMINSVVHMVFLSPL